jgi:hypothetical protein
MRGRVLACALLILIPLSSNAQPSHAEGADAVAQFTPGSGSGANYGIEYYPANVLGLPDTSARADVATTDPKQVLGLGLGGVIVLRFDRPIADVPGMDFTVFENAFHYTIGGSQRTYAEPGVVGVSRDGESFIEYPFDSLTLAGCAGVTPTNGDRDPGDPAVSGGDSFDLASLGIDSVRYIRIRDVTSMVKSNRSNPFWDMTLNGFDLDAVVALRRDAGAAAPLEASNGAAFRAMLYPNPIASLATLQLTLDHPATVRAHLVDALGRDVRSIVEASLDAGEHRIAIDAAGVPNGVYMIAIDLDGRRRLTQRAVIAR